MGKKLVKNIQKIHKKSDPFTAKVIDPILGEMGLWNVQGRNKTRESAEEQAKLTRAQQEQQQRELEIMNANFAVDLKGENLSNVVAGGTAEAAEGEFTSRRRRQGGLTSSLGGLK